MMQPNWASLGGLQNQPRITSAITMDNLYSRPMDSNGFFSGAVASGYMRPNVNPHASPTVLSNSSPYSHQTLEYPFHPPFPVGAPHPIDPVQFPNVALASSFPLHPFQQQGSASHSLSVPPSSVPYGQPISYLPQQAVMMANGSLNQVHQISAQPPSGVALKTRFDEPLEYFYSMMPSQRRRNKPKITSKTNLYIIGLDDSDNDDTLRSLVDGVVQPKSCKAMMDKGKCTGAGFIDCASESDAECARLHIINKSNRPKLSVKYADENEKDIFNVYVRNLPRLSFTEEKFKALFREYGPITSVKLIDTKDGSTVIGFVRFERSEDAERAIEEMNKSKSTLPGCNRPITCKLADKAEPRRRIPNVNNTGGLSAHAAENKVVGIPQTQVLRNHLSRNSNPSQALNHSQTQHQSLYSHQHPLATLLQSFQQAHIAVANIQPSPVTAHTRAVLVPSAVIPNGASGPAVMAPISFASVGMNPQNNANTAVPYPLGFASQHLARLPRHLFVPAATFVAPSQIDNPQRSKSTPNAPSGNYANNASTVYSTQSAQNNFQPVTHGTPITSTFQANLPFVQPAPAPVSNAPNSQMMLVTLPSVNCLYQQTRSSTSSHAFTTITNVHDYISTLNSSHPNNDSKTTFSNQTSECPTQSAHNNIAYPPVDLVTSDAANLLTFPSSSGVDSLCPPVVSSPESSEWKSPSKMPTLNENPASLQVDERINSLATSPITDRPSLHIGQASDNGIQNHEPTCTVECADTQEFESQKIVSGLAQTCLDSGTPAISEQNAQPLENLIAQDSPACVSEPNSTINPTNIPLEFNGAVNCDRKTELPSKKYNRSVGRKSESPPTSSQC